MKSQSSDRRGKRVPSARVPPGVAYCWGDTAGSTGVAYCRGLAFDGRLASGGRLLVKAFEIPYLP